MPDRNEPRCRYAIRLEKAAFTFSAAHFITYAGDICEPLHGHNYRVAVRIDGPLDENAYVQDFVAIREALAAITATLDHRVLLPTQHEQIRVEQVGGPHGAPEVVATFQQRRWVFPADECVLLPLDNTTAERLAHWIGRQLLDSLARREGSSPRSLSVEVDECDGQIGICGLDQ